MVIEEVSVDVCIKHIGQLSLFFAACSVVQGQA